MGQQCIIIFTFFLCWQIHITLCVAFLKCFNTQNRTKKASLIIVFQIIIHHLHEGKLNSRLFRCFCLTSATLCRAGPLSMNECTFLMDN